MFSRSMLINSLSLFHKIMRGGKMSEEKLRGIYHFFSQFSCEEKIKSAFFLQMKIKHKF